MTAMTSWRSDPPLYGLDIETDTTTDGLDPRVGRVLAVAVASSQGAEVVTDPDEGTLLARLDRYLAERPAGVIVTWNGARFDLPYLASRASRLDLTLGLVLAADPSQRSHHAPLPGHAGSYRARWGRHRHLDVYRTYRADVGPVFRMPCSLKAVAGLAGLSPVEVDASRVHVLGPAALADYVASDAVCTRELARRRWATARLAVDRLDGLDRLDRLGRVGGAQPVGPAAAVG
jgi:DNA polymerase family B, exonuclease domain